MMELVLDAGTVRLRVPRGAETGPPTPSPFEDWGPTLDPAAAVVPGRLLVECGDEVVGDVSWRPLWFGPTHGSRAWEIGIALRPQSRGRGIGSVAQRLLVEHLFATTDVFRIQASTDVANVAEQRALERAGFAREGILRQCQVRADGRHDLVLYSRLRDDR
jgi:RimJ/RimL family protein N-acetyltransferase